jgi:hypothetical protein
MTTTVTIPTYPAPKREEVPVKQTAVERSIAKPDAFAKPGSLGNKTRVRLLSAKPKSGRQRKRKPDPRRIHFF